MFDAREITEEFPLPPPPAGWFDYGYAALNDGRLALVRTRKDVRAEHLRWSKAASRGNYLRRYPNLWNDDIRLSIFDGTIETDIVTVPSGSYPVVDQLPDGRWLVVSSRAREGEENGRIYTPDGRAEHTIILGDGIESVLCAPDGTLWVGYFDEGVFGGPNADGSWPVSSGGVVQFDMSGRVTWSFNQQADGQHRIDDAYAMTLSGNTLWTCYYSDFPIARIDNGQVVFWPNRVTGARAIAVKDDVVMLGGSYSDESSRITLVKLEGQTSRELAKLRCRPLSRGTADTMQGRGDTLHIIVNHTWSKLPVHCAINLVDSRPLL